MTGFAWGNSYFAYQLLVTYLFDNLGHISAALIFGFLASLGVMILLPAKLDLFKSLAIGLAIAMAMTNLGVRPHTISFLLFAILVFFVHKNYLEKPKHILLFLVLFAVWANFHRAFLFGLVFLAGFICLKIIETKMKPVGNLKFGVILGCLIASIVGSLITPDPINLWKSGLISDLLSRENLFLIAEWQPLAIFFPSNLLFALGGAVLVFVFRKKINEIDKKFLLATAFTYVFSFLFTNLEFFFVVLFIYLASRYLEIKIKVLDSWPTNFLLTICLSAVILAILANYLVYLLTSLDLKGRLELEQYPVKATQFLKENMQYAGIFNEYGWGGFLDWQEASAQVFIDGRMASWRKEDGRSILADYVAIYNGQCNIAQKYDIKTVLIKKEKEIECFRDWEVAYQDEIAKVLVKK